MRQAGLSNLIPKWRGDREGSLRVSGLSGKDMNKWNHANVDPSVSVLLH